ncbi:MAG: hypothetical protein ACRDSN_14915, partial [Pseudonocardiaceae bacterium]
MTRTPGRPPTLIVDFHRVVIDSEYALYRLWRDQFHQRGVLLTTEAWAEYRITGATDAMTGDNALNEAIADILARRIGAAAADLAGLANQLAIQHRDALAALPARPGITAWLHDADRAGWRCLVISAVEDAQVRDTLTASGLSDVVHLVIEAPSDGCHALVATASPTGVAQARAAGCGCLAIPDKLSA